MIVKAISSTNSINIIGNIIAIVVTLLQRQCDYNNFIINSYKI
jgi:hypothetical protein